MCLIFIKKLYLSEPRGRILYACFALGQRPSIFSLALMKKSELQLSGAQPPHYLSYLLTSCINIAGLSKATKTKAQGSMRYIIS